MLEGERRARRVLEEELVSEAAHPPQHGAGLRINLGDLAQAPERDHEIPVAVEVKGVAMGPVDVHADPARRIEIGDVEVIERTPLK